MNVNQVSFTGAPNQKKLSKGQKTAAIAGAVATAGAIATTAVALYKGKGIEGSVFKKIGAGYKVIGQAITGLFKEGGAIRKAYDATVKKATEIFEGIKAKFRTAPEAAEEAIEVIEDAVEEVAEEVVGHA